MLDFLARYQVHILLACGSFSLMLAFFVMIIRFHSFRKKSTLLKIQFIIAVLMISDAFSYMYEGVAGDKALWILRITNFLLYMITAANMFLLTNYLTALFMEGGKFDKLPKRLLLGFVIPSVQMTLIIVAQFGRWLYYFDSSNHYQRGSLNVIGYILPLINLALIFTFVIQHRKLLNRMIWWSVFIFCIMPVVAAIIQFIIPGFSFLNLASWIASVTLFWFALMDQNEELSKAANTDLNSGLPNTYGYLYEVDRIIHHADITDYDAYYFDIVRMSNINNKYGKQVGDEVIRSYGQYIRDYLNKDEIVGRLGGNFYVALVKKARRDEFLKLLQAVPIEIEFCGKKESISIAAIAGGYEIDKKNIAAGQIISNTATAVVYAKNVAHKPYVFLDEELVKELEGVRILEENARLALQNDEFEPFYQPKIDSRTNTMCGAEALARWRKEDTLIPPMDFVPVMERNGSVCDLDFYILERVCMDIKMWMEAGFEPVPVSVNFSRKNLGNPILAEAISKVVEKHRIPKELIQIEITETLDEFPMSYLVGVVKALQGYGLSVAIDDFGTGSSSIKLLKDVKFDVIKIDKVFVDYANEQEKTLLRNIIKMTEDLNIRVIAEGVEKYEQIDELKSMGCYDIQGYAYDKPLMKFEFENRLKNKQY